MHNRFMESPLLNLSIMPLDAGNINSVCDDVIEQQRTGVSTHAMFIMYFDPEGTPLAERAGQFCRVYDLYRERLDAAGAKHGVLVQSTMGHIGEPSMPHPLQPTVSLETGTEKMRPCCPLDKGFQDYIRRQMCVLASHKPSLIMIDDDVGILYRHYLKGCACPLHMGEFNRRIAALTGRIEPVTREELFARTQGHSEEDKKITDIYVELVVDSLVEAVKAMREGIDSVDPSIQGIVSGICTGDTFEHSDRIAAAFAGKNNPRIVRLNNGMYTKPGGRDFTVRMQRAAQLREHLRGKADILLAETDTCPHNRYSTSATMLHAHFAGTILEGAKGAKHWITRLHANEPNAGRAYRKILAKHRGYYEALADCYDRLTPFGCRIPLSNAPQYGLAPSEKGINVSPWSTCVLERLGLPLFFGSRGEGAIFLDDLSVDKYSNVEIREFFKGTFLLSGVAAQKLNDRGFAPFVGVRLQPWTGKSVQFEEIDGHYVQPQVRFQQIVPQSEDVSTLSYNVHHPDMDTFERLFPAATAFGNPLGGRTVVFCGTPDTYFSYAAAFSFLNESRKIQLIKILEEHLLVYYPGDAEVYIRAGRLDSGEILCAIFNLGLDVLDEIPLVCRAKVSNVEKLSSDGNRMPCAFDCDSGKIIVKERSDVLSPTILFII